MAFAQRPRIVSVLTPKGSVALPAAVYTCMQVLGQAVLRLRDVIAHDNFDFP
jgi:hypothetical protein